MNPGLTDQPRPAFHPSQRHPRDAATLILVDRSGAEPRILLGQRHRNLAFMPGYFVFPGGKVEAYDSRVLALGRLSGHVEAHLQRAVSRPSPARARAYALAAIRELAEETGLMVGELTPPKGPLQGDWSLFAEKSVTPTLDDIWLVARSVTPPGLSRRYDTRFFAADASRVCLSFEGTIHPDAELVDLRWATFEETREMNLHAITRIVLDELQLRLETGIDSDAPVPFFRSRGGVLHRLEI